MGQQSLNFGSGLGAEVSLKDFRKDISRGLHEAGSWGLPTTVFRCCSRSFRRCPISTPMPMQSRSRAQREKRGSSATWR